MPRVRRRGHKRNDKFGASNLTRSELLRALVDGLGPLKTDNPLLEGVPECDRPALIRDAWELHYAEREARREPELRDRLATWPASAWGTIFCERPDWEAKLTAEQNERWQAFLERVRRDRLRESQGNVLRIPAKATETIQ
ncbi:MAG: hypothetical protein M3N41_05305 [Acidobacteriota bacterium]|nr:hypothetical protein [Acidobacteriota bacterium]